MNLKEKITEIVDFIFEDFGIYKDFPEKKRLLIHDNVHGTLNFKDYERKIINSPFLQRLTQIRQMGLANFVYPGAIHTRFIHSLGVSYISSKIIESLFDSSPSKEIINSLRLAGLLHDIGFGPFSHLSDAIYSSLEYFPEYNETNYMDKLLIDNYTPSLGISKNIHEIVAYHLLNNKRFKEFLEEIYHETPINLNLVPLLITGNHIKKEITNEEESIAIKVINGFSDADKIDYIYRDSLFTGLPLPIDFDRLYPFFTKISFEGGKYFEIGVQEKGARAFHLLLSAKSKMFPTIYHHHTTIACESLLMKGIINIIRNFKEKNSNLDMFHPINGAFDLLFYTDNTILNYLKMTQDPIATDVVNRLNKRKHYRRIVQLYYWELFKKFINSKEEFMSENGLDSFDIKLYNEYKEKQEKKIDNFQTLLENYSNILEFKKELVKKAGKDYILNKFSYLGQMNEDDIIDYIIEIRFTPAFPKRPYEQPYIKTSDSITKQETLMSLNDLGYRAPKDEEILSIIFYAFPEIVDLLKKPLTELLREKLGEEIMRSISFS